MPAKSEKQQQLFGIVRAIQTGEMDPSEASPKARKLAKSMSKEDVKDYAETKHKGLPEKKSKNESRLSPIERFRVLSEAVDKSSEYKQFFRKKLASTEYDSIEDMSDAEKKKFFDKVDAEWLSKKEKASNKDSEYKEFFRKKLKASKYNSINDMPDDVKKKFFNTVDAAWKSDKEKKGKSE